jgi:hypothetical protein
MTYALKAAKEALAAAKADPQNASLKNVADYWVKKAESDAAQAKLRKQLGNDLAPSSQGGTDLKTALRNAGIDGLKAEGGLIPLKSVLNVKADIVASEATAAPQRVAGVSPLGQDKRFLHANIATESIPYVGVPTRIDYLRQSARTYPTTGDATLALDHSTAKPTTDVVVVEAQSATKVFGTVSSSQPNALLGHDGLSQIIQSELRQVLAKDVEKHVIDTIRADSNVVDATQGTDVAMDAIYKALQDLVDGGYNADLLVLNPADAESIYLAKDANDHYLRESGSDLWGVRTVLSSQMTAGHVLAMDARAAKLYASEVAIAFDPFTEFSKNRTTVRAELYGTCTVSQGFGVVDLALA